MKFLDLTLPTPAENLACDEQLLAAAERGDGGEVLRVWESPQPFVAVGYANKIEAEVNVAACAARNIPVLRRCSGGGTVVIGPGCLCYALVLKIADRAELGSVTGANRFIMDKNREAVESESRIQNPESRIEVCGHTDLVFAGKKFSGNAQRRRRNFILFHGTFLLDFNLALIGELLPLPSRQPDYRASRAHEMFLANVPLASADLKAALRREWCGAI
jgi:lipoate-protein ligase A